MNEPFLHSFISELRRCELLVYRENAARLADVLEQRLTNRRGDSWDLAVTGNDEADRVQLADWLDRAAHAPPFLSPSWGRTFSEAVAWIIRHRMPLTADHLLIGIAAPTDPDIDERIGRDGAAAVASDMSARALQADRRYRAAVDRLRRVIADRRLDEDGSPPKDPAD